VGGEGVRRAGGDASVSDDGFGPTGCVELVDDARAGATVAAAAAAAVVVVCAAD
jgi:hypothetical protein